MLLHIIHHLNLTSTFLKMQLKHYTCTDCVKSVLIRNYSAPYFSAFRLNTEGYSVSLRIQSECGKIRTRITLNTNTFYLVTVTIRFYKHETLTQKYMTITWKLSFINMNLKVWLKKKLVLKIFQNQVV